MRNRRHGFTLIEMIVVIGIIVVLAALLLPMIGKAYRSAQRTAMSSDLQAIAAALEAYKKDFGDYPRVRAETTITTPSTDALRPNPMSGAEVLCWALVGPAQATEEGWTPATGYRPKQDGLTGPGFRTGRTSGPDGVMYTADDTFTGKAWGPYLPDGRFKVADPTDAVETTAPANVIRFCLMDRFNMPILYFPASPAKPNIGVVSVPAPYVDSKTATGVTQSETSLYDGDDNLGWFTDDPRNNGGTIPAGDGTMALKRIRLMLGDVNGDGVIQAAQGEQAVNLPYLLWSAGPDEHFGPFPISAGVAVTADDLNALKKCDDATNFGQ